MDELPKIYFQSLGCFKNTVDSEGLLAELGKEGFELTNEPEDAGVIVVNTCGFIDPAKEESIEALLEASLLKSGHEGAVLVAIGCLVERYKEDLPTLLPEVDLFLDLEEEKRIGKILKARLGIPLVSELVACERTRPLLTPAHVSFLKIAEGCSRHCTFCTIGKIRGAYRSRNIQDLIDEACRLESAGVKELNIISQDTVSYRDGNHGLVDLLENLLTQTNIPWVRLLYMNPAGFEDALIDLLSREERLLGYVDIPIQHISDRVLKRMGRESRREDIEKLISRLKDRVPAAVLRTTVMVGFPGETEKDFLELMDFIEEMKFDRLGVFSFSCEEGTPAALLDGRIPEEVIQERSALVQELQRSISQKKCHDRIGELSTVLVDVGVGDDDYGGGGGDEVSGWEGISHLGRSRCEAYDVDGLICLAGAFRVGEFCRVRIVDAGDYDLLGVPV